MKHKPGKLAKSRTKTKTKNIRIVKIYSTWFKHKKKKQNLIGFLAFLELSFFDDLRVGVVLQEEL